MPKREAIDLFNILSANPERAKNVDWDMVLRENPDLDFNAIRRDFGKYLPEAPTDADARWYLAHPLHQVPRNTFWKWFKGDVRTGWEKYKKMLGQQEKLEFVTPAQRATTAAAGEDVGGKMLFIGSEEQRIVGNWGMGAMKALAGLPVFIADIFGITESLSKGDIEKADAQAKNILESLVSSTAKAAALTTSRIESRKRPPTKTEREMYKSVTGGEAFGVTVPFLMAFGGPRLARRGFKAIRAATAEIVTPKSFQRMPRLEGVKGEFVKVGEKPSRVFHKHPERGWEEYRTKKVAGEILSEQLDAYVTEVTPGALPAPKMPKLLPVPPERKGLPPSEIVSGEGFTAGPPKKGESATNTYLRMPLERVRKDAAYGVRAAHEALEIRKGEEGAAGQLLKKKTPLAKKEPVLPTWEETIKMPIERLERIVFEEKPAGLLGIQKKAKKRAVSPERKAVSEAKIEREASLTVINEIIDDLYAQKKTALTTQQKSLDMQIRVWGRQKAKILGGEAGYMRIPTVEEARAGAKTIGKVVSFGEALARPSQILQRSPAGQKMIQRVIKAETVEKTIRANAEVIMDNAIRDAKLNRLDKQWMRENFKTYYEEGQSMPNARIQRFADAWAEASGRIGQLAEKVNVKIRGQGFKRRENYFPHVLTEQGRLALEAQSGDIWNAIIAELEKRGKTTEGIETTLRELSPREEATAVRRHGSLENPRLLDLPEKVTVNGKVIKILETDPLEAIPQYISRSSRRIGIIKSFGQGNEFVRGLLKEAGENIEARKAIENAWRDVQRFAHRPSIEIGGALRVVRPIENITRASLLSLAQLANVPGEIATVYKAGLKNSARAFIDSFRRSKSAVFEADRKLGAWSREVLRDLQTTEDLTGKTGKFARGAMKAYGFEGINRHINKVGSRAMQLTIEDYFDILKKGDASLIQRIMGRSPEAIIRTMKRDFFWTDMDIARIRATGLSTADRARVAQRAPALINIIGESVLDRPSWIRHPVMQRFMAYTSFGRAMGNILADTVREARHGNFKPLATFMAGQQLAGELEIWLKNFVLNKERTDKDYLDRLVNNALGSMTLGVWGLGYEKLQWARGNPVETVMPPNIEVPIELAWEMGQAISRGDLPKSLEAVADRIPIWRAGVTTAERVIAPEQAELRKKERTQRILKRYYNKEYNDALNSGNLQRARQILHKARDRGVSVSRHKRKEEPLDVFKMLGAG